MKLLAGVAALALVACTAGSRGARSEAGFASFGSDTGGGDGNASSGSDAGTDAMKLDVQPADAGLPDHGCAVLTETAQVRPEPADIVFVIDNSASMADEVLAVHANMNDFSSRIIASGVDVHVVVISDYGLYGVCIEPPLGGGGCPDDDDNVPLYHHVPQIVGSRSALLDLLATYEQWRPSMRDDARKHIVVVTDDDDDQNADDFDAYFRSLHPSHADYEIHGIVSKWLCPEAANVGEVYIQLGMLTGGIISDLCDQDFEPVFDRLSTAVVHGASLACRYEIPDLPDALTLDPERVNVDFHGAQGVEAIGHVEGETACAGVDDGWYYDDPDAPTTIIACPTTCQRFGDVGDASIDIVFGCETIPAG